MKKPVIFLAFANDKVDETRYLRNLSVELHAIRTWLLQAEADGLCELVERMSVTVSDIIEVFENPKYKDRIGVFHYGGHADGFSLLLENADGTNSITNKEGLVSFFARQHSLKLIFLNGCSSEGQTNALLTAGIPAVIGTMSAINDEMATQIAERFYKSLSMGAGIEQAWNSSIDEVKMTTSKLEKSKDGTIFTQTRDLHWKGKVENLDQFPWKISFKDGSDIIRKWNLPDESENPLFGLPDVPQTYTLPETPFLYLQRYERKHAEIFFGRSTIIRNFYQLINDKNAPSLILLYGQSGVGKSSLLEAGLEPRLEEAYHVLYLRRDDENGLSTTMLNSLNEILGLDPNKITQRSPTIQDISILIDQLTTLSYTASPAIQPDMITLAEKLRKSTGEIANSPTITNAEENHGESKSYISDLKTAWLAVEKHIEKPLIVIMDQVEEAYTRGTGKVKIEFTTFFTHLQNLLNTRSNSIQGKLVLSFRKEYQSEVDQYCKNFELSRSNIFLEHLDKGDIHDLFRGFEQNPRLKARYNLTVASGVAETIGEDLTDETGTPIAAMLQILLTKMWHKAIERSASNPIFSHELYREIRQEGIAMDEFLAKQLDTLTEKHPESSRDGLTIDVLAMYTTVNDTATSKTHEELTSNYPLAKDEVIAITHSCQDLFLLTSIGTDPHRHMLAHDTLAKSVKKLYHASTDPLQQAKRIISSKMESIQSGAENAIFDEWDLALLKKVKHLLPNPDQTLAQVLVTSILADETRKKDAKTRAFFKIAGVLFTIFAAVAISLLYFRSVKSELRATITQKAALSATNLDKDPTFSLQQASIAFNLQENEKNAQVNSALISSFYNASSKKRAFYQPIFSSKSNINQLLASKNGNIFIPRNNDYEMEVINQTGDSLFSMSCDASPDPDFVSFYNDVKISPDGNYILALMSDSRVQMWSKEGELINTFKGPYYSIDISPNSEEWLGTIYEGSLLTQEDEELDDTKNLSTIVHLFDNHGNLRTDRCIPGEVYQISYHPKLPYYVYTGFSSNIVDKNPIAANYNYISVIDRNWKLVTKIFHSGSVIMQLQISKTGNLVIVQYSSGKIDVLNMNGKLVRSFKGEEESNNEWMYSDVAFSNNDSSIAITRLDSFATIYNVYKPKEQPIILAQKEMVTFVKFSPFGGMVVTGSSDATAKVWDSKGVMLFHLIGHKADVTDVHFASDKILYTSSSDGQILKWTLTVYEDKTISIPKTSVSYIDLDSTDQYLVSSSSDNIMRIWDMKNNSLFKSIDFTKKGLGYANFISKTEIIGSNLNGEAFYMKLTDDTAIPLVGHTQKVTWLSNLGDQIITAGEDSTLRFWNKSGNLLRTIQSKDGALMSLAIAKKSKKIAVGCESGAVYIYDAKGNVVDSLKAHNGSIIYMDISNDGKILVTASTDSESIVWNIELGKSEYLEKIKCSPYFKCQYNSVIISNDQKYILAASTDRIARVFDLKGRLLATLSGHKGEITSAYFSNDDQKIYTFSTDKTIRIWDKEGNEHGIYSNHTMAVNNAVMNSTNKKIYSCSDDGTIRTWLTPSGIYDWVLEKKY